MGGEGRIIVERVCTLCYAVQIKQFGASHLNQEHMSAINRKSSISLAALTLLFIGMVVIMQVTFTSKVPGANDFYPRWKGAQGFWLEGIDPYSTAATEAIQQGMYGRLATPTEDQALFVYPFYTIFLLIPLVGLSYAWVSAIWLTVLLFALVIGVVICLQLLNWQPPLWLLSLLLIWSIIFYNSARTIILGQFSGLIFVWIVGCLLALRRERDILAAVLLSLATIKPQMSFLLIPVLMLWGIGQRRWRFVGGFIVSMAGLAGLSFLLLPHWLLGFIEQVQAYPGYTVEGSPVYIITRIYLPQLGAIAEYILFGLVTLFALYHLRNVMRETAVSPQFLFSVCVTLVATNLLVSRTATTNYVVLYLPLLWGLQIVAQKWRHGHIIVATILLIITIGMWSLFLTTISGDAESAVMFLPIPFILLLMLFLGQRIFLNTGEQR